MSMSNVSAFGLSIVFRASSTFPSGFTVTQFADDQDPFSSDNIDIGEMAMNVNGDAVFWKPINPIAFTVSVIAGSDDQLDLQTLWDNNRAQSGRRPANDVITATINFPNGSRRTLTQGVIVSGPAVSGVSSEGRRTGVTYGFSFAGVSQ